MSGGYWELSLPKLLSSLVAKDDDRRALAASELRRMAQLADELVERKATAQPAQHPSGGVQ